MYRADTVGSLLRPDYLVRARARFESGEMAAAKFDELESADQLIARIDEAARFYPRDQLALSTQCGFASAGPGNAISEDAEEKKLRLIAEVADRAWGGATAR